jgi:anti-sigma regulatory factor (Ser/Thr protein kinase)/DNA-binding XRE family transcriptional regulator
MPASQACCVDQHWTVPIDGERLRRARMSAGLSQEDVADVAGVSVDTVGRLERQDRLRCHFRTRARIAAAVGAHPKAITAVPDAGAARIFHVSPASAGPGRACSGTFPARADQLREARAFLRRMLAGCPLADDVVLICSELAANAVEHSASTRVGGQFTVRAEVRDGDYAWIEVEDQGGPWVRQERSDARGRGLVVVDELAAYWDIRGDDTARVVCARLDWPAPNRTLKMTSEPSICNP